MRSRTETYAYIEKETLLVRLSHFSRRIGMEIPGREWTSEAECRGGDSDLFYPAQGGSVREAKQMCDDCLVQMECLEYAIDTREPGGIWGGLAKRNRDEVMRAMARRKRGLSETLTYLGYRILSVEEKEARKRDDLVESVE